jgi:hypothetical protein
MRLTPEQDSFKELIARFFQDKVTPEYRRSRIATGVARDPQFELELTAPGLLDGFSGDTPAFSFQELGLLAEECGYFLVPEPLVEELIATAIAAQFLHAGERAEFHKVAQAHTTGTIAYPDCCQGLVLDGSGAHVSGSIAWAPGVEKAGWMLAFVGAGDAQVLCAFSLTNGAAVRATGTTSLDLTTRLHSIELTKAPIFLFTRENTVKVLDSLLACKAGEVAGICRRVIAMTVEYAKTRQQFGAAIGSFQAIQQKIAQCYAHSESLTSLSQFASWSAAHSPHQRTLTSQAAILAATEFGPMICETAIQAHGGIGFTWEYDLHLYLRRAKLIEAAFGLNEDRARALVDTVATS